MKRILSSIDAKGELDPRLGPDRATDIASVIHSHEAFLGLTVGGGWSGLSFQRILPKNPRS